MDKEHTDAGGKGVNSISEIMLKSAQETRASLQLTDRIITPPEPESD